MIISKSFPGDCNEQLKLIQHDLYSDVLPFLLFHARDCYLRAARLLGVDTDLLKRVVHLKKFDHRVLQDSHGRIAAHYRFAVDPRGQMPLASDGAKYEDTLRHEWRAFFSEEAAHLSEDDEIVVAMLSAIAYENMSEGYMAEARLLSLLNNRYPSFDDRLDFL